MPSGILYGLIPWRLRVEGVKASIPVASGMLSICRTLLLKRVRLLSVSGGILGQGYPPSCSYIIQSYDTAFSKSDRADYSAITLGAFFIHDETARTHCAWTRN